MSEILALVLARGGSVRLPGKNVRDLHAMPLIGWSIKAALDSPSVTRVVVSTDCPEILETARAEGRSTFTTMSKCVSDDLSLDHGPWTPGRYLPTEQPRDVHYRTWVEPHDKAHDDICPFGLRPAALATDKATSEDTIIHALDWLRDHEGYEPDLVVLLQPTSPLRTAVDVEMALGLRGDVPAGEVTPNGAPFTYMNEPRPVVSTNAATGDRNGAVYICSPNWIRTIGEWEPATAYPMPPERSVDIDTLEDFQLAEWLMGQR